MHTTRLALLSILAAIAAAAAIAPNASAASQRYASPTGSGDCSSASPCSITDAVLGANAGDEVIVNPGDYSITAFLLTTKPITIHGVDGQLRPRLQFSGPAQSGLQMVNGGTLRYVEIDQTTAPRALLAYGVSVDQVIAKAPGTAASPAVEFDAGTMRKQRRGVLGAQWTRDRDGH